MMYDYHFNVMKEHYGNNINLLYTDTGIIIMIDELQFFYYKHYIQFVY